MSQMLQIQHVPEELHSILKARAAQEAISLCNFLKREGQLIAQRAAMQK